jgi:probable F420-dependent oxidoreductase
MKVGAVYPQIELNGDPEAVERIGRGVETMGYDHLILYDHVVGAVHENRDPPLWERGPYTDKDPFHDPLVVFGYLAGITRRLEFMTGILILPQRQTVLVAKQATDVDLLSGGRLRLGVGTGWNYVEYDALGQDFYTRGARLTEQIQYLRKLWEQPLVTFEGRFDRLDRAALLPRPRRQIPIYCGGFSEPAYKRAAQLADGFIFAAGIDDSALPGWKRVQELLKQAGRSVQGFGAQYTVQDNRSYGLAVPDVLDNLKRWQDAGGTHAAGVTMGRGFETTDQHLDYLNEIRQRLQLS